MPVQSIEDVLLVTAVARRMAVWAGFPPLETGELAIVASELANNILMHGEQGQMTLEIIDGGLALVAEDRGDGLTDPHAFEDGWSRGAPTEGESYRPGRSRGCGLGAVRRLSDRVIIDRSPLLGGARVRVRRALPGHHRESRPRYTARLGSLKERG